MSKAKIHVKDDGPYELTGSFEILDDEGNVYNIESSVNLCRCGHSDNKPFCDSSHENVNFKSRPRAKRNQKDLMVEV